MAVHLDPANPIQSFIDAFIEWAQEALTGLPTVEDPVYQLVAAHDYDPPDLENDFPDMAVVIEDYREFDVEEPVASLAIQQGIMGQGTIKASIVVAPDHPDVADRVLRGISGALSLARRNDSTLGGRMAATEDFRTSFVPPLARLANGAIGRQVTVRLEAFGMLNEDTA